MIRRLRPLPTSDELAAMYAVRHDHRLYGRGHDERVEATIALALENIPDYCRVTVADLSCGNGEIARRICPLASGLRLGDIAGGEAAYNFLGPIEETIHLLQPVGAFVSSETIEHLDNPAEVLAQTRRKAGHLVLSTPLECWDDGNSEHLWAWDQAGVEELLARAGWRSRAFTTVDSRTYDEPYLYGIWVCE